MLESRRERRRNAHGAHPRDRQILLFDASGDGRIAELHGTIGPGTGNLGVHVPGTGTDMSTFDDIAGRSRSFVGNDPDGELAMISWLGGDMPDGVAKDAPFNHYARDMAPALADFSHDVRQELDHSPASDNRPSTTYLGHSYGAATVGLAETHGLDDGSRIDGPFAAHSGVFSRESDAWNNMFAVLTGGEAEGYRPPTYVRDGQGPGAPLRPAWGEGEMVDVPCPAS